jgi:SAM-dependent methyltransferase
MIPDWKLPTGVDRGLWDYLHSAEVARAYDDKLAGAPLLEADLRFAARHFPNPGRLIDLGCGPGRLLLAFARRGFACTGVDLSEAMLAQAAAKAGREGLTIAWLKANLVELDAVAAVSFDYAACLFSTLGMIRGERPRAAFLAHVHRLLKPGGTFVVHVHNRRFGFGRHLGARGKEKGDRTMPQAYGGADLTLHHFTRAEVERLLHNAGFVVREVEPVGLRPDGALARPWLFPAVRAYGYLLAATTRP